MDEIVRESAEINAQTKVVEIIRCDGCPMFRADGIHQEICLEMAKRIPEDVDIPEWCPLEDKK